MWLKHRGACRMRHLLFTQGEEDLPERSVFFRLLRNAYRKMKGFVTLPVAVVTR